MDEIVAEEAAGTYSEPASQAGDSALFLRKMFFQNNRIAGRLAARRFTCS
jgi:hypothetical protein